MSRSSLQISVLQRLEQSDVRIDWILVVVNLNVLTCWAGDHRFAKPMVP